MLLSRRWKEDRIGEDRGRGRGDPGDYEYSLGPVAAAEEETGKMDHFTPSLIQKNDIGPTIPEPSKFYSKGNADRDPPVPSPTPIPKSFAL